MQGKYMEAIPFPNRAAAYQWEFQQNQLQLDKNAQGDHSTFKRDANGNIYKYQEWKKNDRNPNGFDPGKRFDGGKPNGTSGAPHNGIATPHINEKNGVRPPYKQEIPRNQRFSISPNQ